MQIQYTKSYLFFRDRAKIIHLLQNRIIWGGLLETEQPESNLKTKYVPSNKTAESYFTWKFNSWIIQFWTKFHENWKIKKKVWHCVLATVHALTAEAKLEGEWNQRVRHFSHHIVVRSVQLPVLLLRGFPHSEVLRFWNFKFLKSDLFSALFSKKCLWSPS